MMYALSWARLRPGRRSTPGDHEPVELPDGRCVVLRPVSPGDDAAEQSFVRALSTGSRVLRFHAGMRELPPPLLRALTHVDQRSHVAVVA
ncbi:MAG TPA: hypothetical protein VJ743_03295, partial [Albitalea sp.]|nr:hypothetical protein [Albitalea sp.]